MFGKLINGQLVFAGERIQVLNGWITKPSEEELRANGYKEVEYTEKPTFNKEEIVGFSSQISDITTNKADIDLKEIKYYINGNLSFAVVS